MPLTYILWGLTILLIIGIIVYVIRRIRHFSRSMFGTESLVEGLKQEKLAASHTPRSLHSMEPIYLPIIQRDFPELNIDELKMKAERVLLSSLQAISTQKISYLSSEAGDELRQKIQTRITELKEQNLTQYYDQVKLHRTVISDYKKQDGLVYLTLQTALESFAKLVKDEKVIAGDAQYRSQLVFSSHYLYIQDIQKLKDQSALGIQCPQCGAPVSSLGNKFCTYCGSGIKEINLNVWRLMDFHLV